jgi:hypothetical protein
MQPQCHQERIADDRRVRPAEVTRMNPSAPISPDSCSEPAHPRDIEGCDIPLMNTQTLALNRPTQWLSVPAAWLPLSSSCITAMASLMIDS